MDQVIITLIAIAAGSIISIVYSLRAVNQKLAKIMKHMGMSES